MRARTDATITLPLSRFEAASDAALQVTAVAHDQAFTDDPNELTLLDELNRYATRLLQAFPQNRFAEALFTLCQQLREHDVQENAKHRVQLELGRRWAPALDRWRFQSSSGHEAECDKEEGRLGASQAAEVTDDDRTAPVSCYLSTSTSMEPQAIGHGNTVCRLSELADYQQDVPCWRAGIGKVP